MEKREEDLPAQCSTGRNGAPSRHESDKLPDLRPTPQQRWKLPVSAFIEECYRKRFGGDARDADLHVPEWRAQDTVDPDILSQTSEELRQGAQALDTGAPLS